MTAQQIFEFASSFLYERDGDDADSKHFSLGFLNVLLQEALSVENSIREHNGQTVLTEAPLLSSLSATVPYADSITRIAFPYGLAANFYAEAMNTFQAENYRAKYVSALNEARKYTPESIVNVYESEE